MHSLSFIQELLDNFKLLYTVFYIWVAVAESSIQLLENEAKPSPRFMLTPNYLKAYQVLLKTPCL